MPTASEEKHPSLSGSATMVGRHHHHARDIEDDRHQEIDEQHGTKREEAHTKSSAQLGHHEAGTNTVSAPPHRARDVRAKPRKTGASLPRASAQHPIAKAVPGPVAGPRLPRSCRP